MTVLIAMFIAAQAAPAIPPPPVVPSLPPRAAARPAASPIDWPGLPPLPWRVPPVVSREMVEFVDAEFTARRCVRGADEAAPLIVEIAVMIRGDGGLRAVVPRAIDCPTVEQFAAGLVTRFARDNLRPPSAGWYRATLVFDRGR